MVAWSEWVCWMWIWPAGRKQKEMLFRDGWWTKSCTSTWRDNLYRLVHPLYPLVQCWVSFIIEVVQDFGHSTSFFLTTKHCPNVKEGVRGLVLGCKSSGAGFRPPTVPWAKRSLCRGCKNKAAKVETKIEPVTLPASSFTHRRLFYDSYHALAMNWQWTYIERTLNMQWTKHRTLRKLKERANWWKSKEIQDLCVLFLKITINCTDLLLFTAFWTTFNVCSMLRSLYVHCMFNVSFSGARPETETMHLCNPVRPNLT